jgi:predicted nucleic acid-binding protein
MSARSTSQSSDARVVARRGSAKGRAGGAISGAKAFVDTNVLVYAHDRGAGARHLVARALLERLWGEHSGVLSTQVVQEFYVNVRRKARHPISAAEAARLVEDYLTWEVIVNDAEAIRQAFEVERRYRLQFWDALIVQAANVAGADVLYSEDLRHGQVYGTVELVNPFVEP